MTFDPEIFLDEQFAQFAPIAMEGLRVLEGLEKTSEIREQHDTGPTVLSLVQARQDLPTTLARAHFSQARVTVSKHGKPFACIIGNRERQLLEQWEDALGRFNSIARVVPGNDNEIRHKPEVTGAFIACLKALDRRLA